MAFLTVHALSISSMGMFLDPFKETGTTLGQYVCMSDIVLVIVCVRLHMCKDLLGLSKMDFYTCPIT